MNWKIKALLMDTFSHVPLGTQMHYFAQKHITRSLPSNDKQFVEIVGQALRHVETFERHHAMKIEEASFYEFGAGWELGIPLSFYCLGVQQQTLVDIRNLLKVELVNATIDTLRRVGKSLGLRRFPDKHLPTGNNQRWVRALQELYGIKYLAPCDARKSGLPERSFDFISSTNTMEHIPAVDIQPVMKESRRLLKEDGILSFLIDYKDHYSYSDPRISAYNFLKYSDSTWRWYNPGLHYQNRLRHADYLRIMQEEGFEVTEESRTEPSENDLASLRQTSMWKPFRENYDISELGIRSAQVVVRAAS